MVWRQQQSRFYRAQYELAEALRERVKELNCLYAIADLIEKEDNLEKILQDSADVMPKGWFHTEIACARITFKGRQYQTGNFHATDWRQSSALKVEGQPVGMIELCYLEEQSIRDEGPFSREERNLINAIAERLGRVVERKQAVEALNRSETKFHTLYDSTRDAVMLLDEKGFFDCNPAALAVFGCATREEFCSKHPADVSPPTQPDGADSRTLANQRIATALKKGSDHFEWMHKRVDTGELFPAEVLLSAMELDGKPVLQAVVRDITARKQMEGKLRQLSTAVEQSPASIVITDTAGDIEYVNPKFVQVTGYTLAEALGKNPRILKSGEKSPEAYRELWETITAGKEWRGEFHNKKKSGELYWESASISPIRDLAGRVTHYVAVKEDITARKQTEAERDKLIHDLQEALANVKSLSGLLPICASCKKIRDDKGYWSQVESYIQKHSEATFTHGICPDCIKKWYPDLAEAGLGESPKEAP
jgi:PAS domain S-box-containing protein